MWFRDGVGAGDFVLLRGRLPNWNANLNILEFIRVDMAPWSGNNKKMNVHCWRGLGEFSFLLNSFSKRDWKEISLSFRLCYFSAMRPPQILHVSVDVKTAIIVRLASCKGPIWNRWIVPCYTNAAEYEDICQRDKQHANHSRYEKQTLELRWQYDSS